MQHYLTLAAALQPEEHESSAQHPHPPTSTTHPRRFVLNAFQEVPTADGVFKMDVVARLRASDGTYKLLAIEADGPQHFTYPDHRLTGATAFRNRALQRRGYTVVSVPAHVWRLPPNRVEGVGSLLWELIEGALGERVCALGDGAAAAAAAGGVAAANDSAAGASQRTSVAAGSADGAAGESAGNVSGPQPTEAQRAPGQGAVCGALGDDVDCVSMGSIGGMDEWQQGDGDVAAPSWRERFVPAQQPRRVRTET